MDLKENTYLSRKEGVRGLLVEDCAKQRLRGENVHEICLGGIETITRYIFHDLVGEADKFAVIA